MGRPTLTTVNQDSDQYIGLLSFWPFGSADSPTLTDFSGNDATGINTNVTLSSDSYFGTVGEFARSVGDNNDSRFEFSGSPDPGLVTTALTVAAWVKVDWSSIPDGESNNMRILCRRDTTSTVSTMSSGWMTDIEAQGDGTAEFRLIARCASVLAHNNSRLLTAAENNTWLHLCVTWNDGEAPILYVNGDSTGTGGSTIPASTGAYSNMTVNASDQLSIGASMHKNVGFPITYEWKHGLTGQMADLRLYDRALSEDQVAALYSANTRWELYQDASPSSYKVRRARTFFYDPLQFKGYDESIDYGGTELPDHYDVTGSVFTKADHWLEATGAGQLVYNREFEHANFAVYALVESIDTAEFAIESRYTPSLSARASFDFLNDVVTVEEYGSSYDHSIEESFNFVDNILYVLSLWAYDDSFYAWINDYPIISIPINGLTAKTFALDFIAGSIQVHKVRVYELLDPIDPSREDETSNTLVQYRKILQEDLATVTAQNWAAYKKAHNRYRYNRNIGAKNLAWESMGYPVPKPSTDAFFND